MICPSNKVIKYLNDVMSLFLLEEPVMTRTEMRCDSARAEVKGFGEIDPK